MKWQGPKHHDKRTIKKFAWHPVTLHDGTKIWWESFFRDDVFYIEMYGGS